MGHYIRFFASGNQISVKWIHDPEISHFVSFVKERIGNKPQQPATTPSSADPIEQLKKLAELKEQGIITEAEFSAKKKQILGL